MLIVKGKLKYSETGNVSKWQQHDQRTEEKKTQPPMGL